MPEQHIILFWIFVGFFVVIGVLSLLVAAGLVTADRRFQQWAVPGFIAAVTMAVIGLFKVAPDESVPIFVTLTGDQPDFTLISGAYRYDELSTIGEVKSREGPIELTVGHQLGVWQAKLPQHVLSKPVSLKLQDKEGNWWAVSPFYPNYNARPMSKVPTPTHAEELPPPIDNGSALVFAATINSASSDDRSHTGKMVARKDRPIKIDNYARAYRKFDNRQYYQWRVFVDEPADVLKEIAEVQYVLHPTFADPTQKRTDPSTKFALESTGWGEFVILITVRFTDGNIEKATYRLDLSKGWPDSNDQ
jgi:hypothetical protein